MKKIIGNLKMNLDYFEIKDYINYFGAKKYSNVYFAPSNIYLLAFIEHNLNTVSQDVSSFDKGAYTGDISASQLKSIGVSYSLVGHSERRRYYQDDFLINQKINNLLNNNIIPILCIGEKEEERKSNQYIDVLKRQIDNAFNDIESKELKNLIIAYEPVWSIGTGLIPSNNEIEEVVVFLKDYVKEKYSFNVEVLYGGSVNNENIETLEKISHLDGYLVGGCSLKIDQFDDLINKIKWGYYGG